LAKRQVRVYMFTYGQLLANRDRGEFAMLS
jgi:hypothetical protein